MQATATVGAPRGRYPVTAALALLALVPVVGPSLVRSLEYDRTRMGEVWRVVTCHFVHFDGGHLFWSFVMCVALAALLEPWGRRRLLLGVVGAAVAIPLALFLLSPELATYRGLSGIDSALFAMVLVGLVRQARADGRGVLVWLCALVGVGFVGKLLYEVVQGAAVFADSSAFEPVPLAHVVGAAVGLGVVWTGGGVRS